MVSLMVTKRVYGFLNGFSKNIPLRKTESYVPQDHTGNKLQLPLILGSKLEVTKIAEVSFQLHLELFGLRFKFLTLAYCRNNFG